MNDVLTIVLCAGLAGVEGWENMAATVQLLRSSKKVMVALTNGATGYVDSAKSAPAAHFQQNLCKDIEKFVEPKDWKGLKAIEIAERVVFKNDNETAERRFFLVSFSDDTNRFVNAVRSHWMVESAHWVLDVTFNEDDSRVRRRNDAQNLAITRRMIYSIMRQVPGKTNIKQKRMLASFKPERITQALTNFV